MNSFKLDKWLPHGIALATFLISVVIFFKPAFFDKQSINQYDIEQFKGSRQSLLNYRETTGEEGLWADNMFSGMPAYLVNIHWGNGPMVFCKKVASLFIQHPIENILIALICYYIMLLSFKVRPYVAIAGALAFAFSSYLIIGIEAGHNSRIGAIAFMPLVIAGVHLVFSGKRILGFGVTCLGMALQLNENHVQVTYYMMLILGVYGLLQLIWAYREKQVKEFVTNILILIPAVLIAAGTFFGPFWAIKEYEKYSTRGPSELSKPNGQANDGMTKSYAFEYSDQIGEPMTLLIPNFYGGSSAKFFVEDQNSESFKALVNSGDNQLASQLQNYTYSYWGDNGAPYYAGAIIVFLFVAGLLFVDKKWMWWAIPLSVLSIVLSWGSNFSSLNYFMFDYFPMYSKFRSVTFALIIILFMMPLIGMIGLEKLLSEGLNKETKKKLLYAFGVAGGLCVLVLLTAGMFNVARDGEQQLPAWFAKALHADRISMVRADAWRSFAFILPVFVILYFGLQKKISEFGFYALLAFLVIMDLSFVDKRSFKKERYQRKSQSAGLPMNAADQFILNDKSYYRVFNLQGPMNEARTSYFHHSLGGYHGAKLKRYQDLYDSCIIGETGKLSRDWQNKLLQFDSYGVLNMLNAKYIVYGTEANNVITNPAANGNAWFVKEVATVANANEELKKIREVNTKEVAVVQSTADSRQSTTITFDSTATIKITEFNPKYLKYESQSSTDGFAVFSEIYYPKGWHAFIDGKETEIQRADYVLRALAVPAGKHTIEFKFEPKPFVIGNKVTMASNWAVILIALGCFGWSVRNKET